MPKFSIIIPCFNCFHLMTKCLKSLEDQTLRDLEVILIDDASIDGTYEKLKDYKKNSNLNIILLQNEQNLGPGKSRNKAIQEATGKFITFMDADDFLESDALEVLMDIFEKEKADCIIFDYFLETKNNAIKQKSLLKGEKGVISKSDALIYSTGSTWGKVYLLENIKMNQIEFPDLKRSEDMPFNKLAIAVSDGIYYCDKNLYHYKDNPDSLMHDKKLVDEQYTIQAFEIIENKLKNQYEHEIEAIFLKEYLYETTMILTAKKTKSKEIKKHIEDALRKYPKVYENEAIQYLTTYQKICMKAIKLKSVIALKALIFLKEFIKKVR